MRRARLLSAVVSFTVALLVLAPDALARAYAGEGWYGPTTDKTITYAMYLVIIFFPTIIVLFSVLQWRLDRRKHARMRAARRRAASADWRGGW
jgi:peptidoglycan biosynthesis protein MviN/MurJ (putative lipid II flippase)